MYNKILVLLDCSPFDNTVIVHIKKLVKVFKSQIYFFHVIHSHTLEQQKILLAKTQNYLTSLEKNFQAEGFSANFAYGEGEPADEIIKKINETDWDLIAMGTHGHKGIFDFLYGSVSDAVKHHSTAPILLIRGTA